MEIQLQHSWILNKQTKINIDKTLVEIIQLDKAYGV